MKKHIKQIAVLAAALALTVSAFAGSAWDNFISFNRAVETNKSLTLVLSPSYAPDIVVEGEKAPWGMCAAVLYPVLDLGIVRGLTGARIDWMATEFWAPSVDVTLEMPFTFLGKIEVTPFAIGGAIFPLSNGNDNGESVGGIYGGGVSVSVFNWERGGVKGNLSIGGGCEKWTPYPGEVYRVGVALTLKF